MRSTQKLSQPISVRAKNPEGPREAPRAQRTHTEETPDRPEDPPERPTPSAKDTPTEKTPDSEDDPPEHLGYYSEDDDQCCFITARDIDAEDINSYCKKRWREKQSTKKLGKPPGKVL